MGLSDRQAQALEAYGRLLVERPELFDGRRKRRIVTDPEQLAAYAAENEIVLGLIADTPYVLIVVDLVESRASGRRIRHPYIRVLSRAMMEGATNVVVFATIEEAALGEVGAVILVDQERHATGISELELPRGFGEPGISGERTALRELEEETGYVGDEAILLGTTNTDTGLTDAVVSFYHVPVTRRSRPRPDAGEAIEGFRLLRPEALKRSVADGDVRDAFTVQALALFDLTKIG